MSADMNSSANGMENNWSEENRRVLGWVAELMNGNSRETALMELSKKREQVPELALIIWYSFGMYPEMVFLGENLLMSQRRCHDLATSRDHICIPVAQPFTTDCGRI